MSATSPSPLITALLASDPAPDRADKMSLYGFLVGSWDADVVTHLPSGEQQKTRGEIHAGWVLQGRALQDVWILPGVFHGTTVRVYDPGLDAWHIHWLDPVMQIYPRLLGRARGADIVQEGTDADGALARWSFTEIRSDSFHWLAEVSSDGGATWRLQLEFFARRTAAG